MAKSKAKLASSKPVATKWLQNAMRSIGVSTKNILKSDFAPNLYEAVESGLNTSKSVIGTLRRSASGTNQLSQQLQNNKYVKFAQTAYKNALSDLKSGNLNNEDRFGDSLFSDSDNSDIDSLFDDSGFSFGDDGADSVNVNIVNASGNNDAMFAMTTQLQKQTEATLKTNQANMNAMIAMNSASMMQTQQIGSVLVAGLDAINKNLSSIIEYNNSSMTKFIESSLAFYERMGTRFDSDDTNKGSQKIRANQVINSASGGINFSQYKQYIKQQFKETVKGSGAGMIMGLLDDQMLQMAASNPLGFATEGLIKFMVPKMLANTIKGVEETFSSFMPSLLHKLADWGDGYADGVLGHAKQIIGKTFGLRIDRQDKIDKSAHIEKGAIPFDGQTKHAITEIITKELREQTSYLKAIAQHYKIDTNAAKNNAEVFDYKTGKYIKASQTTETILNEIKDAVVGSMSSGSFGKNLKGYSKGLDDSDVESFNKMFDELMLRLEKHGKFITMNNETFNDKNSDYSQILGSLSGNKNIKRYLDKSIQDLISKNPNAAMDLSRSMLSARSSRNNIMKDIESNPALYNLYAATGLDDQDIDELIFRMMSNQKNTRTTMDGHSKGKSIKRRHISNTRLDKMVNSVSSSEIGELNATDGTFNQLLGRTGQGISQMAMGILHGSSDEAFNQFTSMLGDQFSLLWSKFNEKFMTPIKQSLLGKKDEDNFSRGGIISGVINGFKDAAGILGHHITGKSFKDSKGKMHESKDDSSTVVGNLKKIGKQVKEGVIEKLFGPKSVDEKGNLTEERKGGILSGFKDSIKKGFAGWQDALFGKKLNDDERKNLKDSMIKNLNDRMPDAITGTAVGAGVGMMAGSSLLGFLVGGPVGGAAMGTAIGFASKSEKFQNWLFGEKDENGERTGGLISKKVQDYFKKNKNAVVGGAAVGTVTGAISGGGLLGSLVGGPVAGAILGMSTALITKSEMFKEFLYGNEKTGQQGVIASLKKVFAKSSKNNAESTDSGKAFGMSMLGAGAGALTAAVVGKMGVLGAALTPFGPIGGALVGLGLSIRAQKDTFHKWLFGEKDENGNKTKEGILGQFGNMLKVSVFNPIKTGMKNFIEDAKFQLKYNILDPIRFAVEPIGNALKDFASGIKDRVTNLFNKIGKSIGDTLINPIVKKVDEFFITPIRKIASGVTKVIWGTTKRIITFPFKLLDIGTKFLTSKLKKGLDLVKKVTIDPLKTLMKTVIINPAKKAFGFLFKGIGGAANLLIKKPLSLLGGVTNYLGDKISGVDKKDKEHTDAGGVSDNVADQRKLRAEQRKTDFFNMRKNARERKIHDQNMQAIAKATNYQLTEDTEENRQIAKSLGAKINDRVAAVESSKKKGTTEGMDETKILGANLKDLSDEGKQTNILLKIFNLLQGKLDTHKKGDNNTSSDDNTNIKNDQSDNTTIDNIDEASTSETKPITISDSERIRQEIESAGGLKNYLSGKLHGARERVSTIFGNAKSWVGDKAGKISGLLSRFKGKGHADGTDDTGDEAAVVGENGPELVDFSKGNKVFANRKPLSVVITGMTNTVSSKFFGLINKVKNRVSENSTETDTDSGDVRSIAARMATSGGSNSINLLHGLNGGKSGEELEDDMAATAAMIESDNRLNTAIDKGYTAAELQDRNDKKEEKALLAGIEKNTAEQAEGQKEHTSIWSSIFSKKGLITAGLVAAAPLIIKALPTIIDGVKKLWPVIQNIGKSLGALVKKFVGDVVWTEEHAARTDGNTVFEEAEYIGNEIKEGNILTDDNGDPTARTNSGTKFLARRILNFKNRKNKFILDGKMGKAEKAVYRGAEKLVKGTKNVTTSGAKLAKSGWTKVTGGAKYSVDDVAKKFGTTTDDVLKTFKTTKSGKISTKTISKVMGSSADDVADLMKPVTKTAEKMVKNGADDAAKSGLFKKVVGYLDDFFKFLGKKIGKNFVFKKITSSGIAKALKGVWAKTVGKITAKITAGTAAAASTLGISEAVFTLLGAVDGATGAAKLFQVPKNKVDGIMRTVATIFGALSGFTYTGVVMLIFDIVGPILGCNILTSLAIAAYNFLVGADSDKAKNLEKAQGEHKDTYLNDRDKTLEKQYETQQKLGIIGPDVTFDMFKAGIEDGTYSASYTSFQDWNAKVNASVGDKIISGGAKLIKGIGKGISDAWAWKFGKNQKYLEDDKGNKYYENDDGTYQVINATGADLGFISKEALPANLTEKKERKKGIYEKAFTSVKNFFVDSKTTGYFATDGTYYDGDGNQYSATGEKLGKISTEELQTMISSGILTKGEIDKKAGIKVVGEKISSGLNALKNGITSGWNKFKDGAKKVGTAIKDTATKIWDKASTFVGGKLASAKAFLLGKTTTAWYDADGGYYISNGSAYDYYNANGDKIAENVSTDDVTSLIQSGNLTEGEIKTDGVIKSTIKKIFERRKAAFNNIKEKATAALDKIKTTGQNLWNNIKSKGLFGGIAETITKTTSTVWYDPNGNYYKINGDTYDYYNANNDLISSGVNASEVQEKIEAGLLTSGTVTTDSAAKKAVDQIKSTVSNAWNKAKDTVKSGWSKFTSWLSGGKGGSISHMNSSSYGDKSIMDGSSELYNLTNGNTNVGGMNGLRIGGSLTAQDVLSRYSVTSNYGTRTINGKQELHAGIDFTNPINSPVGSFTNGTVYKVVNGATPNSGNLNSTDGGGFGNYVVIKDENGNYNYYAHMNSTSVKQGDTVEIGDKLGLLGHTGRSTGPHLHYEVRKDPSKSGTPSNTYNPSEYLNGSVTSGTTSTSGSGISDILSKLSGFLSEFGNRALTGITTGRWDSNYSSYFADGSSSGTTTSDTSSYKQINQSQNANKIWNYYKAMGIPDNTIAGMMGNMMAESGLNPMNLQNSYESSLGHTDGSYTSAVDSGTYKNFVKDSAGYGLVQWTYYSLKQALYDYAKKKNKSIGDMDMQLEFLVKQLSESYPSTWKKMMAASTPAEASTIMLKEFEKPAVLNTTTRSGYAQQYYDMYAGKGGAYIKPRVVKTNMINKNDSIGGPILDSIRSIYTSKDYDTANKANKYISSTSNSNMTKAINMIIGFLEVISGNTASTSSKLDMLKNIKKSNVVSGGNTTNYITNNDNSRIGSDTGSIITSSSGNRVSRNQRIAEKIAQGM